MAGSRYPDDFEGVHVYAQRDWHGTASIVGTRAGLERLREAIDQALTEEDGCRFVFANDGEGYALTVHRLDGDAFETCGTQYEGIDQTVDRPDQMAHEAIVKERRRIGRPIRGREVA